MVLDGKQIIKDYVTQLHADISSQRIGEYIEVTYPLLDRHNDSLQLYIRSIGKDKFELTDDSYIISDLEMCGVSMTPHRRQIANQIAASYGVRIEGNSLVAVATKPELARVQHLLLQCMLRVDDLFLLNRSTVANVFTEDVKIFLDKNKIHYSRDLYQLGKSGLPYKYDFIFQKNDRRPTRICLTHNLLNISQTKQLLFDWNDIEASRADKELLVVYNGALKQPEKSLQILAHYDIQTVDFENKEAFLEAVA